MFGVKDFTKKEFLIWWLPVMAIAAGVFAYMVMTGAIDFWTAVLLVVIGGVVLRWVGKWANPPAPAQPELEEAQS
jgi:hypothetical protein